MSLPGTETRTNLRQKAAAVLKEIFSTWKISRPRSQKRGNRFRVSASVCGAPIWFESSDQALLPAPEAWASAMLIPALHYGKKLSFRVPLNRQWLENHQKLLSIYEEWWNYPSQSPFREARCTDRSGEGSDTGLMFTCGADSFHSLLTHEKTVDSLIFVVGYDVSLEDTRRARIVESHVRRVAAEYSRQALIVSSNLRQHPCFREVTWIRTFIAGLAAVGHVLSGSLNTLLVSTSHNEPNPPPCGSHPRTDPLWGSGNLRIEYLSPASKRLERLLAIANSPIVQRYLRVCWKNVGDDLNCSKCEKCLRTMVGLEIAGTISRCQSFRGHTQLAERIRELPPLNHIGNGFETVFWVNMLDQGLESKLHNAVKDLLERSGYFDSEQFRDAA